MRISWAAYAAVVLLATGCSGTDSDAAPTPVAPSSPTASAPAAPPVPVDPPTPSSPRQRPVADSETCVEVVAGINAFNAGDYDETVARFEDAIPLAESEDDGSVEAALLIQAVRYYAELPAEDYPAAAISSADFARWKAVTLGQCVSGVLDGPGGSGEAPGIPT